MCLIAAQKIRLRKRSSGLPLAALMLLTSSSLLYAQSSQPTACNMDSDGFCIAGTVEGTVQVAPVLSPQPQKDLQSESNPSLPSKLQVEFRNHLLRIDAENATLRDTLKAVSARTGAEIQFPAGALEDRIFAHSGPASPREVVSHLLKGVPFNYVILSSASDPSGITRLILSRASADRESAGSEAPFPPAPDAAATLGYGASFGVDPDAHAEPVANEASGTSASTPVANWVHTDGPKLSGEYLDQMQKMQIQQEQQQFAQQEEQQRQQQKQNQPNSSQQ